MKLFVSYLLGALFSIGLTISGMVNPNKVLGFLDIFREWDPSLIAVMGGAAGLNMVLFKFILKRKNPILTTEFSVPKPGEVDWRLVVGSALFGIGWGLGGVCPGPGIANLFTLKVEALAFVGALLVGQFLFVHVKHKL